MSILPIAPASERNKQPILEQLQKLLAADASVLEIGSGWGQHAVHICRNLPRLRWQPSERKEELALLSQRVSLEGGPGIRLPIQLNVENDNWPLETFDAAFSANTAHIMSWEAVGAMLSGVSGCLAGSGLFCLYGPFNLDGTFTSPGNRSFDAELRHRDRKMGLRDVEAVEKLASNLDLILNDRIAMPANNFLLVFRKPEGS